MKKIKKPLYKKAILTFPNRVKIISGLFRGRYIELPKDHNIRPTTNMNREKLFNWLGKDIQEAQCLDLFAGSGALGLEALSRGARFVTFMDHDPFVLKNIEKHWKLFSKAYLMPSNTNSFSSEYIHTTIPNNSFNNTKTYDVIFIDPPFHEHLIYPTLTWLEEKNFLKANTLVSLEIERTKETSIFSNNWHVLKENTSGSVYAALLSPK